MIIKNIRLNADQVRNLCIARQYFTRGTNKVSPSQIKLNRV